MSRQKVVFLKGELVNLRPLRRETDLAAAQRWVNDPDVRVFLMNRFPQTEAHEGRWFDEIEKADEKYIALAIETKDGALIGTIGLRQIDYICGTAITGTVIGERKYWNNGYGTDAKMTLLRYSFETLNLRRICSRVYAYNPRSVHYSLKCGYKIEGRLRKHHYARGRYWDVILMAVFRNDFERAWKRYRARS